MPEKVDVAPWRCYLAAFDRFLTTGGKDPWERMGEEFCRVLGRPSLGRDPDPPSSPIGGSMNEGKPASTTDLVRQALEVARQKEAKLLRLKDALSEVRREIKVLERTLISLGAESPPASNGAASSADERREAVIAALRDADGPVSKEALAEVAGGGQGMHFILNTLERRGEAVQVDGGWAAAA